MRMREAPPSAAAKLPPWNPNQKAVAGATALQGACGAMILKAAKDLGSSPGWRRAQLGGSAICSSLAFHLISMTYLPRQSLAVPPWAVVTASGLGCLMLLSLLAVHSPTFSPAWL